MSACCTLYPDRVACESGNQNRTWMRENVSQFQEISTLEGTKTQRKLISTQNHCGAEGSWVQAQGAESFHVYRPSHASSLFTPALLIYHMCGQTIKLLPLKGKKERSSSQCALFIFTCMFDHPPFYKCDILLPSTHLDVENWSF